MKQILGAALLCLGSAASAQQVSECDWRASAQAVVEPWEQNSRSFANGDVRLALLDTIEPGAAAMHILVLSPPYDELGGRQCRVISYGDGFGFAGIDFATLQAGYDPAYGLLFDVHAQVFDPDSGGTRPMALRFTLNQATGGIEVWRQ